MSTVIYDRAHRLEVAMDVRTALAAFHRAENLPENGTDGRRLDWARAFGLPVPIVNTRARLAVLPYHDLHHLMTGYRTDEAGEAEVSAWTLATGGGPAFGRLYDLGAYLLGFFHAPRRSVVAYARGRRATNLYGRDLQGLLASDVDALRALAGPVEPALTARDVLGALGWAALAAAIWGTGLGLLGTALFVAADALGAPEPSHV